MSLVIPKKNQLYTFEISDLGYRGEGIGKLGDFVLYVSGAVPGDVVEARIVKVKKRYGYAKLMRVVRASVDRVVARCPVANRCGGCQIQHVGYEAQLRFKEKHVRDCLVRIGGLGDVLLGGNHEGLPLLRSVLGMEVPYFYRNKAQFAIGAEGFGFYAIHSHRIVPTTSCVIQHPVVSELMALAWEFVQASGLSIYDEETHSGVLRHLVFRSSFVSGKVMVCLVVNARSFDASGFASAMCQHEAVSSVYVCHNCEPGDTVLRGALSHVWGDAVLVESILGLQFRISPFSFFQVNPVQTEVLYGEVLKCTGLTGVETVWDLYCGAGSISLLLAQHAGRVIGVESVPEAVENARENAVFNGVEHCEFFCGAVEELVDTLEHPDVVVLDPPRKGCEGSVLEVLCRVRPGRIVYVSCDPATFARDAAVLVAGGYRLVSVQPVDMFAHTMHVEVVGVFEAPFLV